MRIAMTLLSLCFLLPWCLPAQETGASLLSAGRKRALEARGRPAEEKAAIWEDSLRIFKLVPERFPDDSRAVARAWLEAGRLQRRLRRPGEAEAAFRKVLEHREEARASCDALHDLASLYRRKKKMKEAKECLAEIIERFPGQGSSRARALIRLASLLVREKDATRAEQRLRQVLKDHGDLWRPSIDALDDLVGLKIKALRIDEARRILDAETEAIRARFAGSSQEPRVFRALDRMASRARLAAAAEDAGR